MVINFECASQACPPRTRGRAATLALLFMFLLPVAMTANPKPRANPAPKVNPSAMTPSVIVFSPTALALNNPTGADWTMAPAGPTVVPVNLTVYDAAGHIVTPTESKPLHVHVYGAPDGVIKPIDSVLTAGTTTTYTTVTFSYSGAAFPNNMEIAAWMDDPSSGGASLGTTLFVHQNRPDCADVSGAFPLKMVSNVPSEVQVKAVIGADHPQESDFSTFTIDTGSLGALVTKSSLVMDSQVHGPGAAGQKFYDSSGYIFTGNYYIAPVSLQLKDHTFVQTHPILVLAIDGVHCDPSPKYKNCKQPKHADLHYLGIGFDRNSTGLGDLFDSPAENAFLELTDAQNGNDINQGYILSTDGVTLGVTANDSSGFTMLKLDPNSDGVAGDWNPVPGCFGFPHLPGSPQFCGNVLFDMGIKQMYLDLPTDQRPAKTDDSNNRVPDGVYMNIQAGIPGQQPVMSYNFHAVQPPKQPVKAAPAYVEWIDDPNIFINTGRRVLMQFNYLYSGQCGYAGFQAK